MKCWRAKLIAAFALLGVGIILEAAIAPPEWQYPGSLL